MGIKLKGLELGGFGMDYEMLVFPNPNIVLHPGRKQGSKVWYQCPALAYIIEHPDGLILFETGISPKFEEEWLQDWLSTLDLSGLTSEDFLEAKLKSLGLAPEDFKYVIMGHLHCDHAGGLRLFENAGASIVVHEDEYKHVTQIQEAENFFVRRDWQFLGRKRPLTTYGDQEILKDLWLLSLPGHTPGTMGLMAKLNSTGWVLLTSDALYTHHAYGPPAVGSPITWSLEHWANSVEKLRRYGVAYDAFIFPGHGKTGIKHEKEATQLKEIQFLPGHVYE